MITTENVKEIKAKLETLGHGSKKKLAEYLGVNPAQVSLLLRTGFLTPKKEEKLLKWLGKK